MIQRNNSCQEATLLLQLWILPCLPPPSGIWWNSGGISAKMYPPMTSSEGCPITPWKLWQELTSLYTFLKGVPFNHRPEKILPLPKPPYLSHRPPPNKKRRPSISAGGTPQGDHGKNAVIDDKSLLGNQLMLFLPANALGSLRKFSLFNRKNNSGNYETSSGSLVVDKCLFKNHTCTWTFRTYWYDHTTTVLSLFNQKTQTKNYCPSWIGGRWPEN